MQLCLFTCIHCYVLLWVPLGIKQLHEEENVERKCCMVTVSGKNGGHRHLCLVISVMQGEIKFHSTVIIIRF